MFYKFFLQFFLFLSLKKRKTPKNLNFKRIIKDLTENTSLQNETNALPEPNIENNLESENAEIQTNYVYDDVASDIFPIVPDIPLIQDIPLNNIDPNPILPQGSENPDILIALKHFISRHNLTKQCSFDLLKLLKFTKESACDIPQTIYCKNKVNEYTFCNCFREIYSKSSPFCTTCNCLSLNHFSTHNFLDQVSEIAKRFFKLSSGSFNIEYSLFTDGISIFEKSNSSIWPIYIVINNIAYNSRYKLNNVSIVGIYFGNCKPNMQILFEKA